jgi:hypothetical protein
VISGWESRQPDGWPGKSGAGLKDTVPARISPLPPDWKDTGADGGRVVGTLENTGPALCIISISPSLLGECLRQQVLFYFGDGPGRGAKV